MRCSFYFALLVLQKPKQISSVLKRKGSQQAARPLPFSYTCLESFLSPVTMIPGSSLVMQLLPEALSPSARRPLLRDLWLLCHVIQGGSAEGFYVRHAAFITFEILVTHLQPVGATDRSRHRPSENSLCKLFKFQSYSSAEIKLAQNTITFKEPSSIFGS